MLDTFIIEEIRRREEALRRESERPQPRLPMPDDERPARPDAPETDEGERDRGVVIIDYSA